jgi:hypothetical protein
MSYFTSAQEVDCYVGGILRLAVVHPTIGPRLAEPGVVLSILCTDPDAHITVALKDPVSVTFDEAGQTADVELRCPADVLDEVFRGHTSLTDALATGKATARGRVSKVLKVLPVLEQIFPSYCDLVATKDGLRDVLLADVGW